MVYVQRFTNLHPRLWHCYGITAYPNGFHDWPAEEARPVWEPYARIITARGAGYERLPDAHSVDEALENCWIHFASLDRGAGEKADGAT